MDTFTEIVDQVLELGITDNSEAAVKVLRLVLPRSDAAEVLHLTVAAAIRNHRRSEVRSEESVFFGAEAVSTPRFGKRTYTKVRKIDHLVETRAFLQQTVWIPDKGDIPWGDVTVVDHEARITYLHGQIAGTMATISRHRRAIELIQEAGVTCLREIAGLNETLLEEAS